MILSGVSKNPNDICECGKARRKKVALSGCSEDEDAVAALPDDWIPKHSGPILATYLKQREQDHERILKDVIQSAATVNEDVESKIRTLAENLLTHIKANQHNINCIVEQCDNGKGSLKRENRNDALSQINKLLAQRIDDMSTFKREALVLERHRADGLRVILRNEFQRLIPIGHKTPKDLLHDIDHQTYEINQQLLSNSRAYSELEAQLRVQADESLVRARISLNQLCLAIEKVPRGRSALPRAKDLQSVEPRPSSASGRPSESQSINCIFDKVEEVDAVVARLVQAYRAAVFNVFTDFASKLTDLENNFHCLAIVGPTEKVHVCEIVDLQQLIDRTIQRLSVGKTIKTRSLQEVTGTDKDTMQKSLCSLGECLQKTYTILHDAGHLWDAHIFRSALVQKLTIAAVEDLLTSNDSAELAYEVPFNIALEQMRGFSDVDKMKNQFNAVLALLDHTAELYLQHSQAELGRLEEFMNLPTPMANILLSEFEIFLGNHPHALLMPSCSASSLPYAVSPRTSRISLNLPIPRAILQTELQELALRNWRNGFLESFESNVSLVPEELRHQAQLWVEERAAALQMRYSLKMVSHSVRAERVQAAFDARLAELRYHDTRLASHLDAIFGIVETLPAGATEFGAMDAPFLYPLGLWVNRIEADVNALLVQDAVDFQVKHLKMSSYACRLSRHRQQFEESLDVAVAEYKRQLEYRVQEARVSNLRFMSHIRMFSEGGRYSAQEATRAATALMRGSDALEVCIVRAIDNLNRRRVQLLALVERELIPLQRSIDEVLKTGKSHDKKAGKKK